MHKILKWISVSFLALFGGGLIGTSCSIISNPSNNVLISKPRFAYAITENYRSSNPWLESMHRKNELKIQIKNICNSNGDDENFISLIDSKEQSKKFSVSLEISFTDIFNNDFSNVESVFAELNKINQQVVDLNAHEPIKPDYHGAMHLAGHVVGRYEDGIAIKQGDNYYFVEDAESTGWSSLAHAYVKPTGRIVELNIGPGRIAQVMILTDDIEYREDHEAYSQEIVEYTKRVRDYPKIKKRNDELIAKQSQLRKTFEQKFHAWTCSVK